MATYNDIRAALAEAIQTYQPDLNVYYYVPRTFIPPVAIVQPVPHRTIKYSKAQGPGLMAYWQFHVLLVIGQVDEQASQEQAGELISPESPLVQALNTRLLNGFSHVLDAGISESMFDDGLYTYVQLTVQVTV